MATASTFTIPEISFNSGLQKMPVLGFGMAASPPVEPEVTKKAVLEAIKVGYRHFDCAAIYFTEEPLGEAIAEAISVGMIQSREEVFITSKLWCTDAHQHHIVPALKRTLKKIRVEYLDLYLIHFPISAKNEEIQFAIPKEDFVAMDYESIWAEMEECQQLGLTKAIGVSNFSIKKLQQLLPLAKILPSVNQVEVNPYWHQKKLIEFCKENGILVVAFSPLGGKGTIWGSNRVIESQVLKEIAEAKGKTVEQVSLRWVYEQGIGVVMKSFNKDRMKENLDIFNWCLSGEEIEKIGKIPQARSCPARGMVSPHGPFKTLEDLWDDDS